MNNQIIKFLDLNTQYLNIKSEILTAVTEALDSGTYVLGKYVEEFESAFSAMHDCEGGAAVNSGTSALHLALLASGIGPGDEVITSAMSFTATAAAIAYCGAVPVFVEVEKRTANIDATKIVNAITDKTKAIIPVHLYGQPCDMLAIMAIARKNNLKVIEDCAQAHLATIETKKVGSLGDFGCFSFYPGKNLGAYGEGGIVVSNNKQGIEEVKILRDWGQRKKYIHDKLGYNYRMDAIQGAILNVKMKYIAEWTELRRQKAKIYRNAFNELGISVQQPIKNIQNSYHIFSIFVGARDELAFSLNDHGIQTGLHYPVPMHLQGCYKNLGYSLGDFVVAESLADTQLSLPLYPELEDDKIRMTIECVDRLMKERNEKK